MLNQKLLQDPEVREIMLDMLRFSQNNTGTVSLVYEVDKFIKENTKPPVILKTEDGVEVTDENQFIYGIRDNQAVLPVEARHAAKNKGVLQFSTPEARDEYILWNKPLLSGKDIEDFFALQGCLIKVNTPEFTALLKSKIK